MKLGWRGRLLVPLMYWSGHHFYSENLMFQKIDSRQSFDHQLVFLYTAFVPCGSAARWIHLVGFDGCQYSWSIWPIDINWWICQCSSYHKLLGGLMNILIGPLWHHFVLFFSFGKLWNFTATKKNSHKKWKQIQQTPTPTQNYINTGSNNWSQSKLNEHSFL